MSNIIDWGRVLSHLAVLIEAKNNPYFNLLAYCNDNNLNYTRLLVFMEVGQQILDREINFSSDLRKSLKGYEEIAKQLEMANLPNI